MFPQTRWTKPIYDAAPTKSPLTFIVQSLNTEWYIVFMWCIYKMANQPLQIYFLKMFPEVIHGFLHYYQCSSSVWSSRLWPKLTDPHPQNPNFYPMRTNSFFHSRSKGAESDARGQINYPRQPFPPSIRSDSQVKSGRYQRLKRPSASKASYLPPFHFTDTFHCTFLFSSYVPFTLFYFILSLFILFFQSLFQLQHK